MQPVQYVPPAIEPDEPVAPQPVSEVNSNGGLYKFGAAEQDYRQGGWSINALSGKYQIPEATLRRHAKKYRWISGSASEAKRGMVREAMASGIGPIDPTLVANTLSFDELRALQVTEAAQDVHDMRLGLHVARSCMAKLLLLVEQVELPKDVKMIVESNKAAVETIRRIRSLDDDPAPEASVTLEINDGFAELRAAFKKRLEVIEPAAADDDS